MKDKKTSLVIPETSLVIPARLYSRFLKVTGKYILNYREFPKPGKMLLIVIEEGIKALEFRLNREGEEKEEDPPLQAKKKPSKRSKRRKKGDSLLPSERLARMAETDKLAMASEIAIKERGLDKTPQKEDPDIVKDMEDDMKRKNFKVLDMHEKKSVKNTLETKAKLKTMLNKGKGKVVISNVTFILEGTTGEGNVKLRNLNGASLALALNRFLDVALPVK